MKTDRTFTIGSLDLKRLHMQVAERKADKLRRQDDYRKKSNKECAATKQTVSFESMVKLMSVIQ